VKELEEENKGARLSNNRVWQFPGTFS